MADSYKMSLENLVVPEGKDMFFKKQIKKLGTQVSYTFYPSYMGG
jgi:hypothetical protein